MKQYIVFNTEGKELFRVKAARVEVNSDSGVSIFFGHEAEIKGNITCKLSADLSFIKIK